MIGKKISSHINVCHYCKLSSFYSWIFLISAKSREKGGNTQREQGEGNNKKKGKCEINGNGIISVFALITLMIRFCESKRDAREDEKGNGLCEAYTHRELPQPPFPSCE